jgi:ectoine hydroxylase
MRINADQLRFYEDKGFLFIPRALSDAEVRALRAAVPAVAVEDRARCGVEADGLVTRSIPGLHETHDLFRELVRHGRLADPATQIVGSDVHVYQFEIDTKVAFSADARAWRQDYIGWREEGGMVRPRAVNVVLYLDEVNEFNGPMFLVPGSHREGVIEMPAGTGGADVPALKYSLDRKTVTRLCDRYGLACPKGPAGSVLFFHGNLVHGSAANISPYDCTVVIVTYNSVQNIPIPRGPRRAELVASPSYAPIGPLREVLA